MQIEPKNMAFYEEQINMFTDATARQEKETLVVDRRDGTPKIYINNSNMAEKVYLDIQRESVPDQTE